MPAKRDENIETEMRTCAEHGEVEFRLHKVGVRNGVQRTRWRCPLCHSKAVAAVTNKGATS